MAAAQRQKVDEPKAEARVRLPNVEGPMTKVGLPNAGAGENTEVDSLSGKRTADAVSAVYEDVIDWQTRRCISCIPRRHFYADAEERCLANRLAVVLRRRTRRLAWMSDEVPKRCKRRVVCKRVPGMQKSTSVLSRRKRRLASSRRTRQLEDAMGALEVPSSRRTMGALEPGRGRYRRGVMYACRAKLTKVQTDLINSIPGVSAPKRSRVPSSCRAKLKKVQTDFINSTPGVSCNDLSSWSQWRRMLRASTASVPHAASADCCHMNTPSELSLRGINIQYPFSRLILFGVKTVEVRTYPLGDRNLGGDYEDLFLIETPGSRNLKGALVDRRYPIGPPPSVAQVIGIVRFSSSEQYANMPTSKYQCHMPSWNKHRSKHRIEEGGHYDWNRKDARYAWYVDNVQPFSEPVPAGEKCLWGYRRPRTLEVTLM